LIFGVLKLKASLAQQFAFANLVAAATTIPLLFIADIPMLALFLFLAGASISPTFITAFGLIEQRISAAKLTEGITWAVTGIGIGMAVGSFTAGYVIDAFGPASGFWVSLAAGATALATVTLGYRWLSGNERAVVPLQAPMPGE
jgi:predicted MFS family arabinose efflux permease